MVSAPDHAVTARALNDAYNARDWDTATSLMTPGVELVNQATGERFDGPDGARAFLAGWATAFPDSEVETTLVVADEVTAVTEFRGRGTHTGPLSGPAGTIPPTGRGVDVPFVQVLEFEGDQIARVRLYFDLAGMLHQLGVMPGAG
jgi:steroid delta-isomerase-like uncharacterized protein